MRLKMPRGGKVVSGLALTGLCVAAAVAFSIPDRFVSTAVLQLRGGGDALDRLYEIQQEVLSRHSLLRIIQQLDLYKTERRTLPLEDIVQQMRKELYIRALGPRTPQGVPAAFSISFQYPDRFKAQAVTGELTQLFIVRNLVGRGPTLAVLDVPSLPQKPVYPNRAVILIMGLVVGLVIGLGILVARRSRQAHLGKQN